jgi:nucleoside-diphosphate-sugar epimerase
MRVLLTGASGFLGRYVLKALQRHGIETVAVGRSKSQTAVPFVEADLLRVNDFIPLMQQIRPTHLLHFAWYAEHGKFWNSPVNLRWVEATIRLVEAFCAEGGHKVVVAGTCAEYDWSHGFCREETTPLYPASLYGTAKDATRRLLMTVCAEHQVSCAWGRIFLPYGPGESHNRLIPSLIAVFRGARAPFGINIHAYRDFLYAEDVADGFIWLLNSGASGAYNVSSGEPTRLADLVTTVASLLGTDPTPVLSLASECPGEPLLLVGDNLKLKALGWRPAYDLRKGLERYLEGGNI